MKTGYPFLAISKKYNMEYSKVLIIANLMKDTFSGYFNSSKHITFKDDHLSDIYKAVNHFLMQQLGYIEMTDYVDIST